MACCAVVAFKVRSRRGAASEMEKSSRSYHVQKRSELCVKICRVLYRSVHGRVQSIQYRKEVSAQGMKDPTLTFGEIVPQSFLQVLNFTSKDAPLSGRTFVDLGSGTGRACICAALSPYGFDTVLGIELMPALCEQSESVKRKLQQMCATPSTKQLEVVTKPPTKRTADVDFHSSALLVLQELLSNSPDEASVQTDLLANMLTKKLGHKVFKACMKEHKSFSRYLKSHTAVYGISVDGKTVSLLSKGATRGTKEEGKDLEDIDDGFEDLEITEERAEDVNGTAAGSKPTEGGSAAALSSTAPQATTTQNIVQDTLTHEEVALITPLSAVTFLCGDMFAYDWWTSADVVYATSLLFSDAMMETLTLQASRLRPGAWVISLKPLLLSLCAAQMQRRIELRTEGWYKMSWQMAKVYIYQVL
jgi:predicted RNA methylase